ncbi:MAG: 50S ribosomal protein L21e [Candidatus Thermoplasmatota archaeon]|jgi:large subunit ribosomal protein L21e|nr:50S ribosomal protein L21e [Candidatus Thermoplasmatota archaeon]MCL5983877.1 50S ribosomal protein L21e [Candidatus Thermoplasmatota archaeon]
MVKSSKGFRSRSRGTFTKEARERGLPPLTRFLRQFEIGQKVIVRIEPSDPHGVPHPRYQGRVCTVVARVGRAYRVEFLDGGKRKQLVANAIHLLPSGGAKGAA